MPERCLAANCGNTHKIMFHCIQMIMPKNHILPKKLITIVLDLYQNRHISYINWTLINLNKTCLLRTVTSAIH